MRHVSLASWDSKLAGFVRTGHFTIFLVNCHVQRLVSAPNGYFRIFVNFRRIEVEAESLFVKVQLRFPQHDRVYIYGQSIMVIDNSGLSTLWLFQECGINEVRIDRFGCRCQQKRFWLSCSVYGCGTGVCVVYGKFLFRSSSGVRFISIEFRYFWIPPESSFPVFFSEGDEGGPSTKGQ